MNTSPASAAPDPELYCGRILRQDFSPELKSLVRDCLLHLQALEEVRALGINYLSAWRLGEEDIWYEFVSRAFCQVFRCEASRVAEFFRRSVIERRRYRYSDLSPGLHREILTPEDLQRIRQELRDEARVAGTLQAIYHLRLEQGRTLWLKDEARVSIQEQDRVCLSFGRLMDVTKEMEAEEELKQTQETLRRLNEELKRR